MMSGEVPKMTCGGCGKSVPWKPEYAGKRLRCKCGFTMIGPPAAPANVGAQPARATATAATAPRPAAEAKPAATATVAKAATAAPPRPAQDSGGDDFAQLMAEAEEYALADEVKKPKEKPKAKTGGRPVQSSAGVVSLAAAIHGPGGGGGAVAIPAAASSGPTSPLLAYAGVVSKRTDDVTKQSQITDVYAPIGVIVAGFLVYYLDAYIRGLHDPLTMSVFVIITCVIDLILVGTAMMIGVKLVDLGLGNIGPAILKIVAVALLPAAIGDIVRYYTFGLFSWGLTLLMYYALLWSLFDMDGQEMAIVTGIIWLVQTWVSFLILAVLFSSLGIGVHSSGLASSGSKGASQFFAANGATASDKPPPPNPDEVAANEIRDGTAVEFLTWIKPDLHGVPRGSRWLAQQQAERYYKAGAKKVWAMKVDRHPGSTLEICHEMVIELPDDPEARKTFLKNEYGFDPAENADADSEPDPNAGKRYIHVPLD